MIAAQPLSLQNPLRVLDIGCGRGVLRKQLQERTSWVIDGVDVNTAALHEASVGKGRTLLYNVQDRKPELKEAYDVAILFDVLEHIAEPELFLSDVRWHLKSGGWILVNVPALPSMFSRYDKAVGHFRRYSQETLRDLLADTAGWQSSMDCRFWGFSLVPLLRIRKALLERVSSENVVRKGFMPPYPWMNVLFGFMMRIETNCFHRAPLGTSLMAAARKPHEVPN